MSFLKLTAHYMCHSPQPKLRQSLFMLCCVLVLQIAPGPLSLEAATRSSVAVAAAGALMPGEWSKAETDDRTAKRFESLRKDARALDSIPVQSYYPDAAQWEWFHNTSSCSTCLGGSKSLVAGIDLPAGNTTNFSTINRATLSTKAQTTSSGVATLLANGQIAFNSRIETPGARGTRLHFTGFSLAAGAEMYIYSDDGEVFGPYSNTGPLQSGEFWSNTLAAEHCNVELRFPADATEDLIHASQFTIAHVIYLVTNGAAVTKAADNSDKMLSCIEDATCYGAGTLAEIENLRKAVGFMLFSSGGGSFICTGGLVNTAPSTLAPYFLTANHCISSATSAASLEVTWRFKTSSCDSGFTDWASTSGFPRSLGATLLSHDSTTDFSFLRLAENPPGGSYMLGWNSSAIGPGTTVYRISHPQGSQQALSVGSTINPGNTCASVSPNNFLYASGSIGGIDGGSSGSPVVNSAMQIVGQLYGQCGPPDCSTCSSSCNVVDGRFSSTYSSISSWLNPVVPGNGPDLISTGASLVPLSGKLTGYVTVKNNGNLISAATGMTVYYMSDLAGTGLTELRWIKIPKLKPQQSKLRKVNVKNLTLNLSGGYLLVWLDSGELVAEQYEDNNYGVIGPLP
ncbi:MAG: trypsin-like peptidase domain-containing protein [Candidatus Sumerlaeaceae bacterium]